MSKEWSLDDEICCKTKGEKLAYKLRIFGKIKNNFKYIQTVHEGHEVTMYDNELYIPIKLLEQILNWYHQYLSYPGATRLLKTIQQ